MDAAGEHKHAALSAFGLDHHAQLGEASGCEDSAVRWLHKAASQGLADACNVLGRCYEEGRGVAKVGWVRQLERIPCV
eukprot:scaffold3118_cov264-Pinguiococcus_pyrenoidosus.AAC.8